MESNTAFNECYLYFIENIWNLTIYEEVREAEARGLSEREVLAQYMASWVPGEPHPEKLCKKIKEWADA